MDGEILYRNWKSSSFLPGLSLGVWPMNEWMNRQRQKGNLKWFVLMQRGAQGRWRSTCTIEDMKFRFIWNVNYANRGAGYHGGGGFDYWMTAAGAAATGCRRPAIINVSWTELGRRPRRVGKSHGLTHLTRSMYINRDNETLFFVHHPNGRRRLSL